MNQNPDERIDPQTTTTSQTEILNKVNEKFEQMRQDVREMIQKNDQASKME